MATAHVSGVAALVVSYQGKVRPMHVKRALRYTATDVGRRGKDNETSYGIVNAERAIHYGMRTPRKTTNTTAPTNTNQNTDSNTTTDSAPKPAPEPTQTEVPQNGPAPTGSVSINGSFTEGFENGFGSWVMDSQRDFTIDRRYASAGSRSLAIDGTAKDATITSPNFKAVDGTNIEITFNAYFAQYVNSGDYLTIDISNDNGETWREAKRLQGGVHQANTWVQHKVSAKGDSVTIRFRGSATTFIEDMQIDELTLTVK
jgi:hypothetical protein